MTTKRKRPHGTGSIVERGPGRYELRVYEPATGRTRTRAVRLNGEPDHTAILRDELASFVVEVRGHELPPDPHRRFIDVAADWRATKLDIAEATEHKLDYHLRLFEQEGIGAVKMGELSGRAVEAFIGRLAKRLAPSTTRTVASSLHAVIKYALRHGIMRGTDPFVGVKLPRERSKARQAPYDEEVAEFVELAPTEHRDLIELMAYSGLRREEVCGLHVGDVHLDDERGAHLDVRWVAINGKGGKRLEDRTKTDKGRRLVPLGPQAQVILRRRLAHIAEVWLGLERKRAQHKLFVFSPKDTHEDFFSPYHVSQVFRRIRVRNEGAPHITPHMLRHWAATKAAEAGVPLPEMKARFGWADDTMALRYAHATGTWDEHAAASGEVALGRKRLVAVQ